MKAINLILAAGLALATTGVFAETGVKTYQIDNVTNVYGRSGVAAVQIKGDVMTAGADVLNSGRDIVRTAKSTAITANTANTAGRS